MALNKEVDFCEKISSDVKNSFLQVYNALKNRETQLLRQIEVLAQHYKLNESYDKCFKQVTVIFDNEIDVLTSIANFGRIDFNGLSCDSDFFKIEDYQKPESDHVSLYKCLENSEHLKIPNNAKIDSNKLKQLIQDGDTDSFDTEQLLSGNKSQEIISEPETPKALLECIEKQDPSLCLHITSGEKIALNKSGCDKVKEHPVSTFEPDYEEFDTKNNPKEILDYSQCLMTSASVPNLHCKCSESVANINSQKVSSEKSLNESGKELNNVSERVRKISMKQPVQVQQWMKQIISEPETEPAPNNVMEHSHIKVLRKESI